MHLHKHVRLHKQHNIIDNIHTVTQSSKATRYARNRVYIEWFVCMLRWQRSVVAIVNIALLARAPSAAATSLCCHFSSTNNNLMSGRAAADKRAKRCLNLSTFLSFMHTLVDAQVEFCAFCFNSVSDSDMSVCAAHNRPVAAHELN